MYTTLILSKTQSIGSTINLQQFTLDQKFELVQVLNITILVQEIEHVPSIHEVHHVNRPINVISMDELEGPWRSKKILLEK
jgi:hypothetical protein